MLASLARELPRGDFLCEPKWDGFRCLGFREGAEIDLRSRHGRPFSRYFPEVVAALRSVDEPRVVLDGELVVVGETGFDFAALMGRLHPAASRAALLSASTPATYVAFDLLAAGDEDLRPAPFAERRARLEELLRETPSGLKLTPATGDLSVAQGWLQSFAGAGIDGVMAKPRSLEYRPGARAMTKVKHERTADCVVAGIRVFADPPGIASLLLALYDKDDTLQHVGVASSFTRARRAALLDELRPYVAPLEGHPWEQGFLNSGGPMGRLSGAAGRWEPGMERDWVPLRPERVAEVAYTQVDGARLRHPAKFRRWRPDRDPQSCLITQLEVDRPERATVQPP
jgi:ATP-dependent DNA ligase